jgi:hypothetical protein
MIGGFYIFNNLAIFLLFARVYLQALLQIKVTAGSSVFVNLCIFKEVVGKVSPAWRIAPVFFNLTLVQN